MNTAQLGEKLARKVKVLIAEDEEFILSLIANALDKSGYETFKVRNVSDALAAMYTFDPHVIISDLDFGPGPDGADLLTKINEIKPWVGMIVLTAHSSPELATHGKSRIPSSAVYLVKSQLETIEDLVISIENSIIQATPVPRDTSANEDKFVLSASQCEILRMMADGRSNSAIAAERGITLRAAEALIQRTFQALDIKSDPKMNSRVVAVRMWQQGKVVLG